MNKTFFNKMNQLLTSILWIGVLSAQNTVVQQFSKAFADVAESARPAVVTIITDKIDYQSLIKEMKQNNGGEQMNNDLSVAERRKRLFLELEKINDGD